MRFRLNPTSPSGVSLEENQQPVRVVQSSNGYLGKSGVQKIVAGTNITVDSSDPFNPIVSSTGGGGGGGGDMYKATYDTNNDGVVDNSQLLQGQNSAYHLSRTNHTGTQLAATISDLSKTSVGLGNVDNTSDANKLVSTAQQTALNLKANIASPTFTGTPSAPTPTAGDNTTNLATTAFVTTAILNAASTYDDVKDYANLAAFPTTGAVDVLYMANDTNFVYRWGGSSYIQVGGGTPADATTTSKGIVQLAGDLTGTAAAPTIKASVGLTGAPTAPTATGGTNTTQIASTAFVNTAISTNDALDVHLAGTETITGAKTFSIAPVVPSNSFPESAVTNLVTDLAAKQATLSLTTTGTSGAATLVGATLNIPNYAVSGGGGTTVNYYSPVLAQEFTYSASNIFTLSQTPGALLSVTIQGQVLQSSEYAVAGTNVTVTPASHTFVTGDIIRIEYQATTAFSSTGGFTANIRSVTASTPVLATDRTILVDTTAGAVTLTYPQNAGQEWKFKKISTDTNAMIIIGATGLTEFGANMTTTSTTRPSYTIQSNGTNGYAL